jgi:hypothetical protein
MLETLCSFNIKSVKFLVVLTNALEGSECVSENLV